MKPFMILQANTVKEKKKKKNLSTLKANMKQKEVQQIVSMVVVIGELRTQLHVFELPCKQ